MTEDGWLKSEDPMAMLDYLRYLASQRKLRLAAVACCRLICNQLQSKRSQRAIEAAEQYADGQIEESTLLKAGKAAQEANRAAGYQSSTFAARMVAYRTDAADAARSVIRQVARTLGKKPAYLRQCAILLDIFGAPYPHIAVSSSLLSWNNGIVRRLAQAAYDERTLPAGTLDNTRLAILADALEEAGCTDERILTHLRSSGEHYRGCWVVDLLLGKE